VLYISSAATSLDIDSGFCPDQVLTRSASGLDLKFKSTIDTKQATGEKRYCLSKDISAGSVSKVGVKWIQPDEEKG
jgi:hypothetical protein